MSRLRLAIFRMFVAVIGTVLVIAVPLPAIADDATTPPPQTGPTSPSGPDGATYIYNAATGMWENDHYIWNPATGQTTPKDQLTYSYNPATGHWDTTKWIYDPAAGKYVPNVVSVAQPPAGAATVGGPEAAAAATPTTDNTAQTAGSSSPVSGATNSTGTFDNFYNAAISNTLNSNAQTGNASVSINTTGGNATSGTAAVMANLINMLQSSTNLQGGSLATFTSNIYGNVQGDMFLDPGQLSSASSIGTGGTNTNSDVTINNQASGQINNNVNLGANSGNAAVTSNTTAGNATSGNADAVANIVNVINSIIGSGQSFMGTVNIYGNLNGDILMPQSVLDSLIASNSAPNISTTVNNDNTVNATFTDNSAINNNVSLGAATGTASVSNNSHAGSATTGNAQTNLTLLNLTGRQVIGNDALLVFVNVLGNWVGMIVNAPSGSTAAALGGGITGNSTTNTDINSTSNNQINNNVTANAKTGNADVSNNTTAGNATSGNATASANLLNIINSDLSLSGWLGILFINVFGSWNGSFGIDTAAGNPVASAVGTPTSVGGNTPQVFRFVPSGSGGSGSSFSLSRVSVPASQTPSDDGSNSSNHPVVLASTSGSKPSGGGTVQKPGNGLSPLLWVVGGITALAAVNTPEQFKKRREQLKHSRIMHIQALRVGPLKK
jgi:hypothetical protein